jgi:signal transduction histidine kinase
LVSFLHRLASVIAIGALVAIFVALYRQNRSARVRFWLFGWTLVLPHMALSEFVRPVAAPWVLLELASIYLASTAFLVSVSKVTEVRHLRVRLFLLMSVPGVLYAALFAKQVQEPWPYLLCVLVGYLGGATWIVKLYRQASAYVICSTGLLIALAAWTAHELLAGQFATGFHGAVMGIFILTGVLFWKSFRRWSPGVITTCAGFFTWAAVWGTRVAGVAWMPTLEFLRNAGQLADVPKLLVAFGMIVTMLEDESLAAHAAGQRERMLNVQMQRFADLTSHLLGGVEVKSFCAHIAEVITGATNFRRVAILLSDDQHRMFVAGEAGLGPEVAKRLQQTVAQLTTSAVRALCEKSTRIGQNSFLCHREDLAGGGATSRRHSDRRWRPGDELLVPLRSPRGSFLGCISLDEPKDVSRITPEEMSKIEMLAADLAVAVENANLQRQLVTTEKLAGIGRLVSGVAHELNNPLTAVLGYAELLRDRAADDDMHRDLSMLYREAVRMKRIIANMLRFAQQGPSERASLDVVSVLHEVLTLRGYELKARGIELVTRIASDLPQVAANEGQLQQVFLNVLNNAVDAVNDSPEKRIVIEAHAFDGKVLLSFADTGGGFSDLNHVFDPFFTTKSVGKGAGLGLSVCYGIMKEHGGEIRASNLHPRGACVTLQFPARMSAASA